jgi:CRISPR/Cas system CMR subunit Cmr4 (Cas7 group RAMP superfamily)
MTRIDRIQLTYQLTFTMPFHFGTGLRVGLIDRTIVRDHDGYLYVPGSTIKGVLREYCEQLSHLYEELDPAMDDAIASPHDDKKALWSLGRHNQPTMVTRIFGSHSSPGRLFFDDARQTDKDKGFYDSPTRGGNRSSTYKSLQTDIATQVRIDRLSRTAARGALYTSEFGLKDLTFIGSITGWLECTAIETLPDGPTYSLLLLLAGLHLIERIGGNKSTGKGQCCCEITAFQCGDKTYEKAQWDAWLDSLEALSYYSSYGIAQEEEA